MRLYDNPISVNNGIKLDGPAPWDDRLVLESIETVFVEEGAESNCTLYGNAYKGMPVSVYAEDGHVLVLILQNDAPYIQGAHIRVDAENYLNYWVSSDKLLDDATRFAVDSSYYPDRTVSDHGTISSGTAMADLVGLTNSEIIRQMLYEFYTPNKVEDEEVTLRFRTAEETGKIYDYSKVIEVGAPYPQPDDFDYIYNSERWNWISNQAQGVQGRGWDLSELDDVQIYFNNTNNPRNGMPIDSKCLCEKIGTCAYARSTGITCQDICPFYQYYRQLKVEEGQNGYFYAVAKQLDGEHPQDSNGSIWKDEEGGEYYADTIHDEATSDSIFFTGGWAVASNAPKTYTKIEDAWAARNDNPETEEGWEDDVNWFHEVILFDEEHTAFFQWPMYTKTAQKFLIFCPDSYVIDKIFAASNPASNVFELESKATQLEYYKEVTNDYGESAAFRQYEIQKNSGITNVMVTFKKVQ